MSNYKQQIEFETKKTMLIKIYRNNLISFDEYMTSLVSLMAEYNIPHIK
jgi:hypothetical protein